MSSLHTIVSEADDGNAGRPKALLSQAETGVSQPMGHSLCQLCPNAECDGWGAEILKRGPVKRLCALRSRRSPVDGPRRNR